MAKYKLTVFQDRFRSLRGNKSQEEFARELGLSRPTVGAYENGTRIPDAIILKNIAEHCKVSTDWLLGLSQYKLDEGRNLNQERLGLDTDSVKVLAAMKSDGIKKRERMMNSLITSCCLQELLDICCEIEDDLKKIRHKWFAERRQMENDQYFEDAAKKLKAFEREVAGIHHRYGDMQFIVLYEEEAFKYSMHRASQQILDMLAYLAGEDSFKKAKKECLDLLRDYRRKDEREYKETLMRIWEKEGVADGNDPKAR